ncbi:uncharacterized protein C7orf31 [Salarias fasciatus]|uniref:uncharacterized protein C7orf31 n=1 Tax=Salarias fasciatus TaxID=181472 RepID=UPI001176E2FE|nr:uncharacterized protein C7orf31 homolog [Salarias fasciatus]
MNHPWGYGGTIPEHFTDQQCFINAGRKKSNNRLNDQLIPKPTDINVAENMIKIATPKEHPYSSHISRFAMFPSFRSPDDPETGVRAASQPFFNPHIPNSAPEVTVQSKTMGNPYRHEILQSPAKSSRKAVAWTGDHGFLDHIKPLKGEKQVFYPTPPKTVLPNLKLRDPHLSLSERTSNMLKNLERTFWLTSYQMDYTGWGPANPLKMDDFQEKISSLPGINPHRTPLRERSFPVFVPSNPKQSLRRRQVSRVRRSSSSPSTGEHQTDRHPDQSSTSATKNRPQETSAAPNEAPHSADSAGGKPSDLTREILHKQGTQTKMHEGRGKENRKVQFDEGLIQKSMSQNSQEVNAAQISKTEASLNVCSRPYSQGKVSTREKGWVELDEARDKANIAPNAEVLSRASLEQDSLTEGKQLLPPTSNPSILPRPLPGIRSTSQAGAVGGAGGAVSILELQNSFSKSEAHRNFNRSITHAAVDLRDNIVTGKKHNFFGINCNYIHG